MTIAVPLHERWGSPQILLAAGVFYLSLTAAASLTGPGRTLLQTR
jgi:hypothetical protein